MSLDDIPDIPLQVTHGCIVASIQVHLDGAVLARFRNDLLELVRDRRALGVVLDLSSTDILDADEFEALRTTARMAAVMGAETIFAGMRPGVVSALVDLGVEPGALRATLDLEEALDLLTAGGRAR